jgi:hypothetical protein
MIVTDKDLNGCEAKRPVTSIIEGLWVMCGGPIHARHVYTCACGAHRHIQGTCIAHQPELAPGLIGCALCQQLGHDCDVTAHPIGGRDQ